MFAPRFLSMMLVGKLCRDARKAPLKWEVIGKHRWRRKFRDGPMFDVEVLPAIGWLSRLCPCRICESVRLNVKDGSKEWEVPLGFFMSWRMRRMAWHLAARAALKTLK